MNHWFKKLIPFTVITITMFSLTISIASAKDIMKVDVPKELQRTLIGAPKLGSPALPIQVEGWVSTDTALSPEKQLGKIVVIDICASWGYKLCNISIPRAIELYRKYHNKGVVFIGYFMEREEDAKRYAKYMKIPYPVAYSTELTRSSAWGYTAGAGGFPWTTIIAADGTIAAHTRLNFENQKEAVDQFIEALLKNKPVMRKSEDKH